MSSGSLAWLWASRRFSWTVSSRNVRRASGTRLMPSFEILWLGRPSSSSPRKVIEPPLTCGTSAPMMAFIVVVLPAPFRPSSATTSSSATSRSTSNSTWPVS